VHVRNSLIPIRYLVNGATVVQEAVERVTYYHVELPAHDVILAEGLPAESFLDTGNRAAFANGGGAVALHPDFALRVWRDEACADLVLDGPVLAAVRTMLRQRAQSLGFVLRAEAALRLLVGGRDVPCRRDGARHRFALPTAAASGRLVSRRFQPARLLGGTADDRELGAAVAALALDGRPIALNAPALGDGWWQMEPGLRWTRGDAVICLDGARELAVTLAAAGLYWDRAA
jgi:hypothetical protein